ncbi:MULTISPECIES: Cof-type HAD-IIB family hydrolase [unclassified Paenibacillus]|uniref:Cof-type HAD-IIB family hydrolase n=1 Tax=unclassified Paenibacillus TaxID=185978 RepID=UPI00277EE2B0|nr:MULTISPECIES: Cof-type HAD-IIB family hydrolase [unclassified Paenibacillus]MDQ0897785.1 HAD superfamily hydrolase (TIGR01484 family) [Paenibacillus sp. V4I7]MDQ0916222.1 HAD superfamily hydrolase (TIGR01484 family) [Paenibacillus sp. V4I5]
MSEYKLLALDMDGTLLTDDKQVTEETKKWIWKAVDHGVTVMFATGRGMQTVSSFWQELELDSPMVLLNGAEIWEGPNQLMARTHLPRETVRRLHELALREDAHYWGYSVESLSGQGNWSEELFEMDWMKFGMKHDDLGVVARIREELLSWGELEITSSAPVNVEISVKGITKESGVREVCRLLGIEMAQVLAVGDSENDISMLRSAGLGVAMGNAEEQVKAIADAVTMSNNEDGVAKAVQKFIFGLDIAEFRSIV